MSENGGLRTVPPYTGQRPPKIRNKDDFPHPFGPTTSKWSPGFNENESAFTRTSPLGEIIGLHLRLAKYHTMKSTLLHVNKFDVFTLNDLTPSAKHGSILLSTGR